MSVELPLPEEPVELQARTRALVEQDPARGAEEIARGEWIAELLWRHWGATLQRHGTDRQRLLEIIRDYRRELWLWVMGERTWTQCAAGLAGRVRRRLKEVVPP
jgi:hypothetical protein